MTGEFVIGGLRELLQLGLLKETDERIDRATRVFRLCFERCASPIGSAAPYKSASNVLEPSPMPNAQRLIPDLPSQTKDSRFHGNKETRRVGETMMELGVDAASMFKLISKYSHKLCDAELKRIDYIRMLGTKVNVTPALQCRSDMQRD